MDISDRIIEARKSAGFSSTSSFAIAIRELLKSWGYKGLSRAAVALWESGNTKNLRPENLIAVSEVTGFSVKWIAIGKGQKLQSHGAGPIQIAESRADYLHSDAMEIAKKINALPKPTRALIMHVLDSQKGWKR